MNFFQRLFSKAASTVARMMTFVPAWARYAFSKVTFSQLVREGYKGNSAVSACATTLQLTFPEPPLLAGYEVDGRFIPDYGHPVMALLQNPNPDMGQSEFMQFAIAYCSIGGNVYIWKQRSVSGKVIALWPFSDAQIQPVAGLDTSEGYVAYYEFMLNGFSDFSGGRTGTGIIIPKEDIIHWKWMIDPQYPWKGIGAIELAAREVDKDNEATAYIFALLKNNAVPPVVITLEEGDDATQEEIDAMGLKWIQKHGKGQPAFISNGMKVDQMGFDLNKLSADTLADIPESRIAANFHVPPSVAGLNVGLKRSDYGDSAARKAFTEQTLMSLWRLFASEMRKGLSAEYNAPGNFVLQFDVRRVGALQEELSKRWERVTLAFNRSMLTRAEAKQELGMVPTSGDDVYFVSLASEFVPAGQAVVRDSGAQKMITTKGTKEHEGKAKAVSQVLLRVRNDVAKRMTTTVDVYFSQLADRVVDRVSKAWSEDQRQTKDDLPSADELFTAEDGKQLETLIKRFYVEVIKLSWNTWNVALGVDLAFDLTDPAVTRALRMAGVHVKEIEGTVMDAMKEALQYGNENGWSIDQLVRGDAIQRGLRDIIDETYKNQSRAIARSELGQAQNAATAERYKGAGVEKVEILDGGADDSAPACDLANGQIWTVDLFEANSLQHPNCSRAAAPYFGDAEPETSWPYAFGERGE